MGFARFYGRRSSSIRTGSGVHIEVEGATAYICRQMAMSAVKFVMLTFLDEQSAMIRMAVGVHTGGQVYCLLIHTAKSVMKSELSKRSQEIRSAYGVHTVVGKSARFCPGGLFRRMFRHFSALRSANFRPLTANSFTVCCSMCPCQLVPEFVDMNTLLSRHE